MKNLAILLILGFLVLTANAGKLSLLSLDDCFHARKGIEMARSGRFFTATWNYRANFQVPPLQSWILGKSFQLAGENDFAARLPSILMAIGILLFTFKIGRDLVSVSTGLTAVALLLITPHFVSNARRCMYEIPLAFWTCMSFFIFLKGLQRPKLNVWLALPIGAALLTKSLLGLLPIFVFLTSAIFIKDFRKSVMQSWFWIGMIGGFVIGATWPIHEYNRFGTEALREHFVAEIFSRSVRHISLYKTIFGYPEILFTVFLPLILPALPGLIKIFRERKASNTLILIFVWSVLPVVLYSFSSARSSRYIFTILPALAIAGAYWLDTKFARVSSVMHRIAVPVLLIVSAVLIWISPETFFRDENKLLKANHGIVRKAVPELEPLPYAGKRYWSVANPLMYYSERQLAVPTEIQGAIAEARKGSRYFIIDSKQLPEVQGLKGSTLFFQERKWSIVKLQK